MNVDDDENDDGEDKDYICSVLYTYFVSMCAYSATALRSMQERQWETSKFGNTAPSKHVRQFLGTDYFCGSRDSCPIDMPKTVND